MNDQNKTKDELIKELLELHQEVNFLKASNNKRITECKATDNGLQKNRTELSEIIKAEEEGNEFAENIINTLREPLLVLDQDLRVVKASRSFYRFFKVSADETVGRLIFDLGNNQWDIPELRELLETILPEKTTFDDYEVEHDFSTIGKRVMLLNARQIKRCFGKEKIILLAIEDITERKSAEELINEKSRITTEYLDILLNHSHAPIIIWDSSLLIKRFNHAFEKLSGYKSAEVIGKRIDILLPEGKIDPTLELLTNRLSVEEPEVIEIDILTKDKELKTVLWNSANIFDKEGKSIVATITQDISSRKRFEDALRNSEMLFRTLVHTIPDLIWLKDTNGVYLSCNPMFERFFGAKEIDIIGKTDFDFVDQELAGSFRENDRKAMEAGMPTSNEEWVTFADDGHQVYLETIKTTMHDSNGILLGVLGIGRDITDRKHAEELVQKQKDEFETIFNLVPAQIWYKDTHNNFIRVNRQVCIDLGMTNDKIEGHSAEELFPSFAQQYFKDDLEVLNTRMAKLGIIEQFNTSKGEIRWVNSDKIPVFGNDGEINGLIVVVQDITGRKRAEEENIMLAHALKSVNECVSITDLDNNILFVNESFLKTYGYAVNELVGQHISLVYSEYNKNKQEQAKEISLTTLQGEWQGELVNKRKDGSEFPVYLSTSVIKDKESKIIGLIGVATDITESKQAENALRQSESRFKAIFNQSPIAIALLDAKGHTIFSNLPLSNMIGYSNDELTKMKFTDFTYHEDVDKDLKQFIELIGGRISSYSMEKRYVHKNGNLVWGNLYATIIHDENGTLQEIIGMVVDITERKQTLEKLLESEEKYRAFFENNMDAILLTCSDGRIFSANPAACSMFGCSEDELVKLGRSGIVDASDPRLPVMLAERKLSGNAHGELTLIRKDGTHFPGEISSSIFKNTDGSERASMIIRDITRRKQIEEKLQESEEQFRKLYENAKIGLYRTTPGGTILMANKALVNLLGFSSFEMLASRNLEKDGFEPTYQRKDFLEMIERDGEVNNFESEWIRLDGSKFFVQESAQAIRESNGNILYFDGVIEDITERKLAGIALIEAKNKAEQSDLLKSAFLTNMSHEIRTPLNGILGFTDLLKEPKLSGEEQREYIEIIEKSGKRMLNIISDIISISIVESGNLKTSLSVTDMNKQIEFLYTFFNQEARQNGLALFITKLLAPNESVILTDKEKVNSIVSNLIKNAIKFTKTGSIAIGCEKKGRYLEFYVKDTGIGIVEEKIEIIFERFRQGSESHTRNYEGAGLGLAISKAYVEALGGKIWVESEEGKGSTFYFTIPYHSASEEKITENNAASTDVSVNEPRKLKILIAEDDETSELLLRLVISIFSDNILTAATGVEAVEVCRKHPDIDLVLMDIKMPDMDGLEAARQIRLSNKEVIIIAQTAYSMDSDEEIALEAGCNDYISKPIDIIVLKGLIQKYFYQKEGG